MAMSSDAFIRVPPDSTGKRITAQENTAISYVNGTEAFRVGMLIRGETSGTTGRIYRVEGNVSTGVIHVVEGVEVANFIEGENIVHDADDSVHAQVGSFFSTFSQTVVNSGANNPDNGQYVDAQGSAYVRFTEGTQQLDASGRTKVSMETILTEYTFTAGLDPTQYVTTTVGGATNTYETLTRSQLLNVTTAAGDSVTRTTHRYHRYFQGAGLYISMNIGVSDLGRVGNKRRWGYYDDQDGMFFELNGTELRLVMRTSTYGGIVEMAIPRDEWNGDPCDGTGVSGFTLDVSKMNTYWADVQSGVRARIGVLDGMGARITLHELTIANKYAFSLIRTASLPMRYENINLAPIDGACFIRHYSTVVAAEANINPFIANYGGGCREVLLNGTNAPILGLKNTDTFNGQMNRVHVMPTSFSVVVSGGNALLRIVQEVTSLTGDTWSETYGAVSVDDTATAITYNRVLKSFLLSPGSHELDITDVFDITSTNLRLDADGVSRQRVYLIGKTGGTGSAPTVIATANWAQLQSG